MVEDKLLLLLTFIVRAQRVSEAPLGSDEDEEQVSTKKETLTTFSPKENSCILNGIFKGDDGWRL